MKRKVLSMLTAASMLLSVCPVFTSGAIAADELDIEWANLKFNADASWGSQWKKAGTETVTIDTEDKIEGEGSLYVAPGEGGAVSLWSDGPSVFAAALQTGDKIEGTCWVKAEVTEEVSNLPPIQIYSDVKVGDETPILAQLGGKLKDGENGWAQYEIASTGNAVAANATVLKYRIEGGGKEYHIDDVALKAVREDAGGAPTEEPVITPEDATAAFEILQFEDASLFDGGNSYGTFEIKTDDGAFPANKGHGALYTESGFSLWGGGAVIAGAAEGSTISGTVAFRLQQPMYDAATSLEGGSTWFRFPGIKIVKASDKTVLAELKPEDFNISEYTAQTWITVNIPSTGETFSSEDAIEYTVTREAGGAKIMIDSVTLTAKLPGGEPIVNPTEQPEATQQPAGFTPEDETAAFGLLQFEDASLFDNTNSYGTFEIKTDDADYPANKGHGALYTENSFSLWGGGASIAGAEAGSTLSGTVAFRLQQPMYDAAESLENGSTWYRFPSVKIVKVDPVTKEKTTLAELKTEDFNISEYSAQTWITVDIPSTGETFSSEDALEYEVKREAGGAKIMIDSVTLTAKLPGGEPIVNPTQAPEPTDKPTEEPAGFRPEAKTAAFDILQFEDASLFDNTNSYGTFEIKTDDADYPAYKGHGALYTESSFSLWGGGGAKITDALPGSTISGTVAFRLAQPMYDAAESLEAGSSWYRFPGITVKRASDKVVLAELKAEDFNISEYEAQKWITVAIPSTGVTISSEDALEYEVKREAGGAKIMIDSITLNVEAPAAGIYIDRAASSTVINENAVSCSIVVANETEEAVTANVIAAVYDADNRLVGVKYFADAEIAEADSESFDADISIAAHNGDVRIRAMIWDDAQRPLAKDADLTGATFGYDNERIAYIGRWTDTGSCMSSSWGGAYFKTVFTGTSAELELKSSANIYVSVDGGEDVLYSQTGDGVLAVAQGLDEGEHTLRVASKYTFESINLASITLDNGAELQEPEVSDLLIEFIGDSNTAGYKLNPTNNCPGDQLLNYSWLTGEALGAEHVHIAYTGMALSDGIYNNNIRRDVGMSVMYDKTRPLDERDAEDWDSTKYSPDLICVNLGANDMNATAVPGGDEKFKETLPVFLAHLREVHPDAEIVVLIPTSSDSGTALHSVIPEVVTNLNDSKINYYDANAWIKDDKATNIVPDDNVHISVEGNKVVAGQLTEIFKGLLGLGD